jgi:hypothetical protein
MRKEQMVAVLAPTAPPCFGSRDVWVSYCSSAAVAQRLPTQPGPFKYATIDIVDITNIPPVGTPAIVQDGMLVTFNTGFDFCGECSMQFSARMKLAGKCNPKALKE